MSDVVFTIRPPGPTGGYRDDGTPFELLGNSGDPCWLTPKELAGYIERCQAALNQWRSLKGGDVLRGHELAEHAYRVLDGRGIPMHYKELYAAIVAPGRTVGGTDPEATLLAAIGRDDRIVSARPRSGLYRVR